MNTDPVEAAYHEVMNRYGPQIELEKIPNISIISHSSRYIYAFGGLTSLGILIWTSSILFPLSILLATVAFGMYYATPKRIIEERPYNYQLSNSIIQDSRGRFNDYFYEKWSYDPVGIDEYDFTTLFGYRYGDDYFSYDSFDGEYYGTRFETCTVISTYEETEEYEETETYTDADGETHTRTSTYTREYTATIFRGEAITLYTNMWFRTYLLLTPYHGFQQTHKMDHDRFNQHYSIICDDPIYVRYLLTQSFMDRLVDLSEFLGISPKIHFTGDEIRITIPCSEKFPRVDFTNVRGSLEKYFYETATVADLLSILKIENHHIAQNESL